MNMDTTKLKKEEHEEQNTATVLTFSKQHVVCGAPDQQTQHPASRSSP